VKTSELIGVLAARMAEHGDMEVTFFDDEPCLYVPITDVRVTKDFGRPVDVMVLGESS
jgi:hypothetical protein